MNIQCIDKVFEEIVMNLRKRTLIPILGAGFSSQESANNGSVPSGSDYKSFMVEEIAKNKNLSNEEKRSLFNLTFSQLSEVYEDDDNVEENVRREYLFNNFTNVNLTHEKKLFLSVNFPYIYTLNIDDCIENNSQYNCIVLPNRNINSEIFDEKKCVIKLHGDVGELLKFRDGYKVFTSKEYLSSLVSNSVLLKKLQHDYSFLNIIFIGCSLDDEIDIKALSLFSESLSANKYHSKIYYCTTKNPDFVLKSKLKTFGITDIIVFENHNQMYNKLYEAGVEAERIRYDELDHFRDYKIKQLKQAEVLNSKIFYNGLIPIDWRNKTINIPYFFIERSLFKTINDNLKNPTIHLLFGNRVSGKTFFLLNLIKVLNDREIYYFNENLKINNNALNVLIEKKEALLIFDNNVLTKEQVETLLLNSKKIKRNGTNVIITLQNNDSDILGLIKWRLDDGRIQNNDFIRYNLNNKLARRETDAINKLLPYCNFPAFRENHTIIDNLVNAENIMKRSDGRFFKNHIVIENIYDLAFYITLATKNKLYSSDIIKFGLDVISAKMLKIHSPFIERIETVWLEKNGEFSPLKYVLNAKYWLFRELGIYAENKANYKNILDAYKYIIRKQIDSTGKVELEIRKNCKDYIMFDTINQIFLNSNNGQLLLCEKIYDSLHEFLAGNYQYLHQFSKCCLRLNYAMSDVKDKIHYLKKGLEKAKVAATMVDAEFSGSNNVNLLTTLAHICYTIATLASELCIVSNYSDNSDINYAIDYSMRALYSPYNKDEYLKDRKTNRSGIIEFLNGLLDFHNGELDKENKKKVEELLSYMMRLK